MTLEHPEEKSEEILLKEEEAKKLLAYLRNSQQKNYQEQLEFKEKFQELSRLMAELNDAQDKFSVKEDVGTNTDEMSEFFSKINKSLS